MPRKGWSSLSDNYRARLEKNGITKAKYEAGESIKKARGHSKTPERPSMKGNFPQYQAERTRLTNIVVSKKHHFFSNKPKWNPKRASQPYFDNPPPLTWLRKWATMTREEWIDALRQADTETIPYFGYH